MAPDLRQALAVRPSGRPGVYQSDILPSVCDGPASGSYAFGGVLLSQICNAAQDFVKREYGSLNHPHVVSANIHFLRPTPPGRAVITLAGLSHGRTYSTLSCSIAREGAQDDKKAAVATVVMGNLNPKPKSLNVAAEWSLDPKPLAVDLAQLTQNQDANWKAVPKIPQAEIRRAYNVPRHHIPQSGLGSNLLTESWMRAPEGQKWDQSMLPFLSYLAPFSFDEAWFPGIWDNPEAYPDPENLHDVVVLSVNVDIRGQLPSEGAEWVYCRNSSKAVVNGKQDLSQVLLDENGRLLAVTQYSGHYTPTEDHLFREKERMAKSKM